MPTPEVEKELKDTLKRLDAADAAAEEQRACDEQSFKDGSLDKKEFAQKTADYLKAKDERAQERVLAEQELSET
jgi:hypothetical protein